MTSVYGVTYVGARDQILNRLQERHTLTDDKQAFSISCYAAKVLSSSAFYFKELEMLYKYLM